MNVPETKWILCPNCGSKTCVRIKKDTVLKYYPLYCLYQTVNNINKLPDTIFDMVISALSIHHLEDKDKKKLFARIYDSLPDGGLFVNYDQFCAGQLQMDHWFNSFWESQLAKSGLTDKDMELWKERRKLDRECTAEQEVDMLKDRRFKMVKCIYSYQKFSVIVAIK